MNDIFEYDKRRADIGYRIKKERKLLKLTQSELAGRVSTTEGNNTTIGQSTVASWEKGITIPPLGRLIILSHIFECDIAYLLGDIKSRKWEHTDINQYTGLTHDAIDVLHKVYQKGAAQMSAIYLISALIETIDFQVVSQEINKIAGLSDLAMQSKNLEQLVVNPCFEYTKDGRVIFPLKETRDFKKDQIIKMLIESLQKGIDQVVANQIFSLYKDKIIKTAPGAANTRDGLKGQ